MASAPITRRGALAGMLAAGAGLSLFDGRMSAAALERAGFDLGPPRPFSFDTLKERAEALAREPARNLLSPYAEILEKIDYNAFFQIVFRKDHALWRDGAGGVPVQFFHLGRYCKEPCSIGMVENGEAREILYSHSYFDMPANHVARQLPEDIGFAGFRTTSADQSWDWMAFLGAAYFRTPGSGRQYGLSARGLAIDTGLPTGEEFPRFTEFWLEQGSGKDHEIVVNALLESPSVTGAYRFVCTRPGAILMDVDIALYPRRPIERLGIAPLTSMFWYGEANRSASIDWRPEIHDNDGLALWTSAGERIWRPLNNPPSVMTNSFLDENPRGFGFLQRDRLFDHYQDDGVFYDRRPSLWVEPKGGWGRGSVQLVEIPTADEIHDNIVAYWVPEEPVVPGKPISFGYRLHWSDGEPYPADNGKVVQNFVGIGGNPGEDRLHSDLFRFIVDFRGGTLGSYGRGQGVEAVVTASRGEVWRREAYPVVGEPGLFRALFDFKVGGAEPVDLRLFLKHGDDVLTETWLSQFFPEDPRYARPEEHAGP